MKFRPIFTSLLLATGLVGCATFSDQEIGQMRHRGVSSAVIGKMQEGHVLTPPDIVELTRRGVPDELIIRQIDDAGVDYMLTRNDFKDLQRAHVSRAVVDAVVAASEDFASQSRPHAAYDVYPYSNYYYGIAPYYYPYPYYYGAYVGGGGAYCGHGHHRH
jgi:hypothetical protein